MAEIVLSFIVGAVFGALIMTAWIVDGQVTQDREPNESGVWPL